MRSPFVTLACLAVLASCDVFAVPDAGPVEPWKTATELVTDLGSEPDTIDPQRASFTSEASIVGMLYEPLLSWDPATLALVPAAARALPSVSDDGLVYTYALRDGLTYSDGSPLVAQRYVDAFRRLCDPNTASEYAFVAYPIAGCERWNTLDPKKASAGDLAAAAVAVGVRALDDRHVEFRLRAASAAFPQATALWVGAPIRLEDVGETVHPWGSARELQRFVGNGPFVLAEWRHNERMIFERNERYRLPVRLARWTKVMIAESAVARSAYEHGELDALSSVPSSGAERDALLGRSDLRRTLTNCTVSIGFNTLRPPFDDANVRLAFAKAVDRDAYTRSVTFVGRPATTFVPAAEPGHDTDDQVQAFDPVAAKRILAASRYGAPVDGVVGGSPVRFTFLATPGMADRFRWLADQWHANLGVTVTLDPIFPGTIGPLVKKPEQIPQLQYLGWCADYPDPQSWYSTVFASSSVVTHTRYFDTAFDDAVRRADAERDGAVRQRLYETASYLLSREAPAMWLMWTEQWWLVRPEVRGYQLSAFDWDFSQLALTKIVGIKR